jgi:exopolysaccharide biosynthesis protein
VAAINGTFFCKSTWRPIGDIVIDGRLAYFGGMGTALCITDANRVEFLTVSRGRHTDWSRYKTVISCGPRLVTNGRAGVDPEAEGFSDSHVLGVGCRTAVGLTYSNRLLLLNTRKACSLTQLANIMKELGCTDAINFDGGASVAMYYRGRTISSPGRKLTNVLLVYEASPPSEQESK